MVVTVNMDCEIQHTKYYHISKILWYLWLGWYYFFHFYPLPFSTQIYYNNQILYRNCCFGFMASCDITPPTHVGCGLLCCSVEHTQVPKMWWCYCMSKSWCISNKLCATALSTT